MWVGNNSVIELLISSILIYCTDFFSSVQFFFNENQHLHHLGWQPVPFLIKDIRTTLNSLSLSTDVQGAQRNFVAVSASTGRYVACAQQ